MKKAQGKRCFSTVAIIVEEKNAKEMTRKGVLQNQKRRIPCLHFSSFYKFLFFITISFQILNLVIHLMKWMSRARELFVNVTAKPPNVLRIQLLMRRISTTTLQSADA